VWCDWQVTLCDPHLSALEVRFSRRCAIQIDVYLSGRSIHFPGRSVRVFDWRKLGSVLYDEAKLLEFNHEMFSEQKRNESTWMSNECQNVVC